MIFCFSGTIKGSVDYVNSSTGVVDNVRSIITYFKYLLQSV